MRRVLIILLTLSISLTPYAQKKTSQKVKAKTTQTKSTSSKKATKTITRKSSKATTKSKTSSKDKQANLRTYSNSSIRGLQGQRAAIQKKIREQEQALKKNQADVKERLGQLMNINSEIETRKNNIEGIQKDITQLESNIDILKVQLKNLEQQLAERKTKYIKSMRYMARHHSVQEKLMFVFSANSFTQMYRRLRFIRQYAAYQKAQGEAVMTKQAQVTDKHKQLENVKGHKNNLLYKGQQEKTALEGKRTEQQEVVKSLQNQQKTIQSIINEQQKKDAALNAQIDRLVAQEVAKARARAAAEAKKKAAAAAAAKRRAEELAKKKAAIEAAARENERRIAEAKAKEEQMKRQAEQARKEAEEAKRAQASADKAKQKAAAAAAARVAAQKEAAAQQAAREAEAARLAAERKAAAESARNKKVIAEAKDAAEEAENLSSADRMLSGGFEANKGRLPMPITGSYRVVSHFGQHSVSGLSGVTLDNKGINIQGKAGANARAIYDGEVTAVFGYSGTWVVMVRHGAYISVYCNLKNVAVHRGQKVSTRQGLGTVGTDNILQFQLRKETAKLNPETWLGN